MDEICAAWSVWRNATSLETAEVFPLEEESVDEDEAVVVGTAAGALCASTG